jgi:hypothetical protein
LGQSFPLLEQQGVGAKLLGRLNHRPPHELEPCLVMGPRRIVVSDSRWRG